jgi:hypothetical protein
MELIIKIETKNSAFDDLPLEEVARVLRRAAEKLQTEVSMPQLVAEGRAGGKLYDVNGNVCGKWELDASELEDCDEDTHDEVDDA